MEPRGIWLGESFAPPPRQGWNGVGVFPHPVHPYLFYEQNPLIQEVFSGGSASMTSIYHLQMNGLVEHFNGILKRVLWKYVAENSSDWPLWLPFLLFAVIGCAGLLGFSPSELMFGSHTKEVWRCCRKNEKRHRGIQPISHSTYLTMIK